LLKQAQVIIENVDDGLLIIAKSDQMTIALEIRHQLRLCRIVDLETTFAILNGLAVTIAEQKRQ
jgi:hypothetical protein